jgi:hypothetical protein
MSKKCVMPLSLTATLILTILWIGGGVAGGTDTKSGEEINWQVISSGGSQGASSTHFIMSGSVGQTAVGTGSSTNFGLNHGYWQDFGDTATACDCEPGNCNGDPLMNIFDITYIISYLYLGGPAPIPYALCSADPNKDCTVNIFDITYLISYLYLSGPPPATCNEWLIACGPPLRN